MKNRLLPIINHPDWPDGSSFSRRSAIILIVSTVLICLYLYGGLAGAFERFFPELASSNRPFVSIYPSLYNYVFGLIVLGLIPMLIVKVGFKESLRDYGLQLGNWRFGLAVLPFGILIFVMMSWFSAADPLFQAEYPLSSGAGDSPLHIVLHEGGYLLYYIGFEFLFRGFMLFGLRKEMGDWNAILIQTLASTVIHIGKPFPETMSAIVGGIVFGVFVLRCRSIYYQLVLHWTLGVSLNLFIIFCW